jgi:beta-N-acetylhexosaminidase
MSSSAFITGISRLELNSADRDFIRAQRPSGFILFKRNIETPGHKTFLPEVQISKARLSLELS